MRVPHGHRTLIRLGQVALFGAVVLASVVAPSDVAAIDGQQLTDLALTFPGTACGEPSPPDETCVAELRVERRVAVISPASGTLTQLQTGVLARTYSANSTVVDWLTQLHGLACGDKNAAGAFAAQLWAMTKDGTIPQTTVGSCTTTGNRVTPPPGTTVTYPTYTMTSVVMPKPTPMPTPTPKKTPKPTPKPTPAPSSSPAVAPSPSAAPTPTAISTATPIATPTAAPTASGPVSPAVGPPAANPTARPTGESGRGQPPAPPPIFASAVLGVTDVKTDPTSIGGSALFVLLLLLFMGFAAELFNDTVENNYDVIAGWFRGRRFGWLAGANRWLADRARLGVLAFLALTALISSFVDPTFGFSLASFAEFAGFFVGLIVVLASFKLPPMLAHRRRTGELGRLRPLPWALVIAALFVLISRVGNLQPGYLYGIVLGAVFTRDVSDREEGRETLFGSAWTLAAAVVGWLGLQWVNGLGLAATDPFGILASTAFAAILVSGMEATAFGLMPLHFMPGFSVYRYSRLAWAVLFGVSVFAFIHILIGPTSGYLSDLTPAAFIAALGVFAAFGAVSIGTWLYFRTRSPDNDEFHPEPAVE